MQLSRFDCDYRRQMELMHTPVRMLSILGMCNCIAMLRNLCTD